MTDLRAAIADVRHDGRQRDVRCPAHDDHRESLSVGLGTEGRVLVKCHAGCSIESILEAVGLTWADLHERRNGNDSSIVAEYDYHDEQRVLLYQVVRKFPKDFRQRRPDGSGWIWSLKGIRRVPYRLPDLEGMKTVCVTEGEKDADRLWSIGMPATTNVGGAGKWRDENASQLKNNGCQQVVVFPDNDPPGEAHGRAVARSCLSAGLRVKLIPLPGLPLKGDVSDFLTSHSKDDLLAIVRDAPLFDPARSVAANIPIELTSLADLLAEPEEAVDWLVEDRIPTGGVVLFVAPPKAGKSTAARELALAVSRGTPWLGWRTSCGPAWLLLFEDKRSAVRRHFAQMGATGTEPVRFFVDQAPADLLVRLQDLAAIERPALIVVDTLGRLIRPRDFNDYALVTNAFDPLLKLARTTGATLLLLHHASSHSQRDGLDAVLGSTALAGSVDNILILKRTDQHRVLSSVQRIGPDLEPTIITLDAQSGRLTREGSKRQFDDRELGERLLVALSTETEPITEGRLQQLVEGRKADQVRVLRQLLGMGRVTRIGAGGRRDPYRYFLASSQLEDRPENHREPDAIFRQNRQNPGTSIGPMNPDLFCDSGHQVPEVPTISREPGNKNSVRTQDRTSFPHNVPDSVVPQVPKVPNQSVSERQKTENPRKHDTRSGSQNLKHDEVTHGRF